MKILMVLENQFPDDERVEKEALSLIKAGHEVHLLCATLKKNVSGMKIIKGSSYIEPCRLPSCIIKQKLPVCVCLSILCFGRNKSGIYCGQRRLM